MATLDVDGEEYTIEDDVLEMFESRADTPKGPIGPEAMHEMIDACGNDLFLRITLIEWLYIWRGMSPKTTQAAIKGCDIGLVRKFANAAVKRRPLIAETTTRVIRNN